MNQIQLQDDHYILTWKTAQKTEWFEIKEAVAAIPGARFKELKSGKFWQVPHSAGAAIALTDLAAKYGFVIHDEARRKIESGAAKSVQMINLSLGLVEVTNNFGMKKELWPPQKIAVQYGILAGSHLNGDERGLGKTPIAIALVDYQDLYPCIVVTKKNNKIAWMRLWQEFTGLKSIAVWDNERRGNAQVDILHYSMLAKLADYISKYRSYKCIVFDEIHNLKNKSTKQHAAAMDISKTIPVVYGFSGNIITNVMRDLFVQLSVIRKEAIFGNEWSFLQNYTNAEKKTIWRRGANGKAAPKIITEFSGVKNEKMLYSTLRANCFIGRKRREVDTDLPPLTIDYVHIESDESYALQMKSKTNDILAIAEDIMNSRQGSLEYDVKMDEAKKNIFQLYELQGLAKLPGQKEWLMEFLEEGEKIAIFAYHRAVQQEILSWFPGSPSILAGQSEEQAQASMDRFQNDPECKQIICSSIVAQEAITLNAASYIAVCEEMWNEKAMEQIAGRIDRGKVTRSMIMYHLNDMSSGSTDSIMMAIRALKADLGKINSNRYFIEQFINKLTGNDG